MNILFYQWDSYMQSDMEIALGNMGIDFHKILLSKEDRMDSSLVKNTIDNMLDRDDYDAVFSFNFRGEIAVSAYEHDIPYIAWIVDSPFGVTQDADILSIPTNYIFAFDKRDYDGVVARGINTIYHQAVAVNVDRLDRIVLTDEDHMRFDADVAFVGSLYPTSYSRYRGRLSPDEVEYLEDVIEKQSAVQGIYMLDELTSDVDMLEKLQKSLEGESHGYDMYFHEGLQSVIAKEITRRDRLMMLLYLSEFYDVALYSNQSDSLLTKVDDRGAVDNFTELPKVYRASKININITYRRMASGLPLRALEIMGAGGFLMSNYQKELADEFVSGVDCVLYDSLEDAAQKVGYYLEHEDERNQIANNGHEKVKNYTYEKQFKKILDVVFGTEERV